MSLITWTEQLEVGVTEIDQQHQKLVQLINGLHNHMLAGDANEIMAKVLSRVIEYTGFHFSTEEQFMQQYNYPNAEKHLKEHKDLVDIAVNLQHKLESGNTHITMETMHFLQDWLQHHILGSDKELAHYLNSQGLH
ncbi:bacteriohemerythrin [Methylocucumis oryzae]|uniref:Hemerythrin-like domain-containing protein n=1 Tax=Methylocucumis oryzae TaxID=1632867 RepID=A0A0F3IEG5_9GAMM|nr:bacteriohemerythrin [Methylocucumis oryzae]KJV05136.1 hypothetical protein VZ94_20325 [Methylocucumis oryzae]